FFSSRRRHTSFSRDWSSDVCSSDLIEHGNDIEGISDQDKTGDPQGTAQKKGISPRGKSRSQAQGPALPPRKKTGRRKCTAIFSQTLAWGTGTGICRGTEGTRPDLYVPLQAGLRALCPAHFPLPRTMRPCRRDHADDPGQPGPRRGPASLGTDHLRGQWGGVPKLGPVPLDNEIPQRTYRGADPPYVFRASHGTFPFFQKGPKGGGHQWNGDPQPLQARGLGTFQ